MAVKIITRAEAKEKGLPRFFTGIPCKRGHISERKTASNNCIECDKVLSRGNPKKLAYMREYLEKNRERENARCREWYQKNKEAVLNKMKALYEANKEEWHRRNKEWHLKNPERSQVIRKASKARRRSRELEASGQFSPGDISALFELQIGRCASCAISIRNGYHVDHIVPISKGGSNDFYNIQLLCPECNLRKHAKDPIRWANENGRLL